MKVKAKDFLEYLCENLDFRFFAGVPSKGLNCIYDAMNANIMHYIPAMDEKIAFNLSAGAFVSGYRAAVLIDSENIEELEFYYNKFNLGLTINLLIIVYENTKTKFNRYNFKGNFDSFNEFVEKIYIENLGPCVVVIEEGILDG
jgi:sulfopyruvate decarboxylase TPP-binding subunit